MIEGILLAALDKTGRRWKTILGLTTFVLIRVCGLTTDWLSLEQINEYAEYALFLTGIGLVHKTAR
jgi:hypothetical protein